MTSTRNGSDETADSGEVIDYRAIGRWLRFTQRAVSRHKWMVLSVVVALVGLAAAAAAVIPPKYNIECTLLAQENRVLVTRSDGGGGTRDPTQGAAETILRRENLVGLAKQTDLVKEWRARRLPVLRLKDRIQALFHPPPDDEALLRGLVDYLGSQMNVWTNQGRITIHLSWPDKEMAYRLVDAAQRSFLEDRHVQEVSTFAESLSILEGHAADMERQVEQATKRLQELRKQRQGEAAEQAPTKTDDTSDSPEPAPRVALSPVPSEPSAETARRLAELPVLIEEKKRVVEELEGFRRRRQLELQAKLEEQRAIYTDAHPAVLDIQQALAVASKPSPQVQRLRGELEGLEAELQRLSPGKARAHAVFSRPLRGSESGGARAEPGLADLVLLNRDEERDPDISYASSQLRYSIQNYQALQDQIRRTRMDLDTAQAAFKYRYILVNPPELPLGPVSPKKGLIMAAALVCGILIGVIGAVALELRNGIIRERWQIEQILSVPVLTEVRLAPLLPEERT